MGQSYRMVTHLFVHTTALHLLFNSMALVSSGESLEQILGTVPFLFLSIQLTVISSALIVLATFALTMAAPR